MRKMSIKHPITIRLEEDDQKFFYSIKEQLGVTSDNQCFQIILTQYKKATKSFGKIIFDEEGFINEKVIEENIIDLKEEVNQLLLKLVAIEEQLTDLKSKKSVEKENSMTNLA